MKRFCAILIVVTLTFVLVGQAAEIRYKVSVDVSCDDTNTKTFIESHIKRELRSLGDVDITSPKSAQFQVNLVPLRLSKSGQETSGTAIAVNYLRKIDLTDWRLEHKYSDGVVNTDDFQLFFSPQLVLQVGDINDLDKICKSIIVTLDSVVLEGYRRIDQQ